VAVPFKNASRVRTKSTWRFLLVYKYVTALNLIRRYLKRYYKKRKCELRYRYMLITRRNRMPFLCPIALFKRANR